MEPITEHLDNAAIKAIAVKYGGCLGKLTNSQKLDVMGFLSLWVASVLDGDDDSGNMHWSDCYFGDYPEGTVEDILNQCDELAADEAVVFITAIANCITV